MSSYRQHIQTAIDALTCSFCGFIVQIPQQLEADHIIPRTVGGSDRADNIVGLCANCHRLKTFSRVPITGMITDFEWNGLIEFSGKKSNAVYRKGLGFTPGTALISIQEEF